MKKELLAMYEEQMKKLTKEDRELLLAELLHTKNKAREKSRAVRNEKRTKGIKLVAIELPAEELKKFRTLLERSGMTKTELLMEMMKWYETKIGNKAA